MITEEERDKLIAAFAAAGFAAEDCARVARVLTQYFAPPKEVVLIGLQSLNFRGLEAHVLMRGEHFYNMEGNHPDGWYQKFYSDLPVTKVNVRGDNPNINARGFSRRTRYLPYRAKQSRQVSRSFLRRVDNNDDSRLLASQG